jgi:hypothetical protein
VEIVSIHVVSVGMVNIEDIDARNLEHQVTLLPITGIPLFTATMGGAVATVGMTPHTDCALLASTGVPELRDDLFTVEQLGVVGLLEVKVRTIVSVRVCNALDLNHGEKLIAHLELARITSGLHTTVGVSAAAAIRVGPHPNVNGLTGPGVKGSDAHFAVVVLHETGHVAAIEVEVTPAHFFALLVVG